MADYNFLIEIGGTYFALYKKNGGLVLKERSVLAVSKKDEKITVKAFGTEAEKLERINDPNIYVFSPFSDGTVANEEYAKLLISHFLKKADVKKKFLKELSCVLCTCCGLNQNDKQQYRNLFYACGIENVAFVSGVYLVALANDMKKFSKNNFVIDMGGNYVDVALVDFEGVNFGATLPFGSRNINLSLIELVQKKYKLELPAFLAEDIKVELASVYDNDISSMKIQVYEPSIDGTITTMVYASDLKEVIMPYLDEILKLVETTLNMLDENQLAWIKQNGIILSGGMSKIAGVEEYFKSKLTLPIKMTDDCENACIIGGSILLSNKEILKQFI